MSVFGTFEPSLAWPKSARIGFYGPRQHRRPMRPRVQFFAKLAPKFLLGAFGSYQSFFFAARRLSKSAAEANFKVPELTSARSWLSWCFWNGFLLQKAAILASNIVFLVCFLWCLGIFFGHWFSICFHSATPLKSGGFGRCAKKAHMAFHS